MESVDREVVFLAGVIIALLVFLAIQTWEYAMLKSEVAVLRLRLEKNEKDITTLDNALLVNTKHLARTKIAIRQLTPVYMPSSRSWQAQTSDENSPAQTSGEPS